MSRRFCSRPNASRFFSVGPRKRRTVSFNENCVLPGRRTFGNFSYISYVGHASPSIFDLDFDRAALLSSRLLPRRCPIPTSVSRFSEKQWHFDKLSEATYLVCGSCVAEASDIENLILVFAFYLSSAEWQTEVAENNSCRSVVAYL